MNKSFEECQQTFSSQTIVCTDSGKTLHFHNPQRHPVTRVQVDGCLYDRNTTALRCDFLLLCPDAGQGLFIELKGSDITHGISQLRASLLALRAKLPAHCAPICLLVCRGRALPPATLMKAKQEFRKHRARLEVLSLGAGKTVRWPRQ